MERHLLRLVRELAPDVLGEPVLWVIFVLVILTLAMCLVYRMIHLTRS